jgi:hypothetical protein
VSWNAHHRSRLRISVDPGSRVSIDIAAQCQEGRITAAGAAIIVAMRCVG